jgi:hypothetical protein
MLLLTSASDLIQVQTSAAGNVEVHASWLDVTGTPQVVTPGRTNTADITTAATTTVVGSPAASTQRNVKHLNIHNESATITNTIDVIHTDGTTAHDLIRCTLLPEETLIFDAEGKWTHYDADGVPKIGTPNIFTRALAADQSNSTTTLTEVTGLTLALPIGTYQFKYTVIYQAAALTTGVRFSGNYTGTVSKFAAFRRGVDTSATAATAAPNQDNVQAAAAVMFSFSARAKSTLGWGTTLSVDTINADMLEIIEGTFVVTAAGNIALWHGSEVAAASTVMAGSSLSVIKVG